MADKGPSFFRDKQGGYPVFVDGSSSERLKAMLNDRLTDEPSEEEKRAVERAAAEARVQARPQLENMRALGVQALAEGKGYAGQIATQRESMKQDYFAPWLTTSREKFADMLIDKTVRYRKQAEDLKASHPRPSRPFPATSPDIQSLNIRLGLAETGTPAEVKVLGEESIQREDAPFSVALASNVRSWMTYRPSWMNGEGKKIGNELLEKLESATWSVDQYESEYAEEVSEAFVTAWRRLVEKLNAGELVLDPIYTTVGALSPLINPPDGADAGEVSDE